MFKIDGNHLSVAGIKFALPQDFYIDIEGMNAIHPDGLRLISHEKDCCISFMTSDVNFKSPVYSLLDVFVCDVKKIGDYDMFNKNETGYIWIDEPQMYEINGLKCAYVKYHTKRYYYYEIHFERIVGMKKQLEILLEIPKNKLSDIDSVLKRRNIRDFCASFVLL